MLCPANWEFKNPHSCEQEKTSNLNTILFQHQLGQDISKNVIEHIDFNICPRSPPITEFVYGWSAWINYSRLQCLNAIGCSVLMLDPGKSTYFILSVRNLKTSIIIMVQSNPTTNNDATYYPINCVKKTLWIGTVVAMANKRVITVAATQHRPASSTTQMLK